MDSATIIALISVTASLFLAVNAYKSHGLSFENTAWMIVAWLVIISVVALTASRMGY